MSYWKVREWSSRAYFYFYWDILEIMSLFQGFWHITNSTFGITYQSQTLGCRARYAGTEEIRWKKRNCVRWNARFAIEKLVLRSTRIQCYFTIRCIVSGAGEQLVSACSDLESCARHLRCKCSLSWALSITDIALAVRTTNKAAPCITSRHGLESKELYGCCAFGVEHGKNRSTHWKQGFYLLFTALRKKKLHLLHSGTLLC